MFIGRIKIGNMIYTIAEKSLPLALPLEFKRYPNDIIRFGIDSINGIYGGELGFHFFINDSDYQHDKGAKINYRDIVKDGDYIVISAPLDRGGILPIKFKIEGAERMSLQTELCEMLRSYDLYLDEDDLDNLKEKISIARKSKRNGETRNIKLVIDIIEEE